MSKVVERKHMRNKSADRLDPQTIDIIVLFLSSLRSAESVLKGGSIVRYRASIVGFAK